MNSVDDDESVDYIREMFDFIQGNWGEFKEYLEEKGYEPLKELDNTNDEMAELLDLS